MTMSEIIVTSPHQLAVGDRVTWTSGEVKRKGTVIGLGAGVVVKFDNEKGQAEYDQKWFDICRRRSTFLMRTVKDQTP